MKGAVSRRGADAACGGASAGRSRNWSQARRVLYTVDVKPSDLSAVKLERGFSERRITADYVADALRDAIHRGELADGAELNQAALATHFGVSRVPVREAMRQLQAEGLIDASAHRLAVVRALDLERVVELYDARAAGGLRDRARGADAVGRRPARRQGARRADAR